MTGGVHEKLKFGPFELSIGERVLRRDGVALHLGSRALDILIYLAGRPGEIITKQELIDVVWSDVKVEEGSLRVHVAAIRKVLGDGKFGNRYIANVQGRGYSFVGSIVASDDGLRIDGPYPQGTLPARLRRMVGRGAVLDEVRDSLRLRRFVTLLGTGGIGKTTIAVAVGHAMAEEFAGEVYFVDLGNLADPLHVARAIGTSLGLVLKSNDAGVDLVDLLRSRKLLIILDSCEHLIEAVASVAEQLFQGTEQLHLLTTSRELLKVEGEHGYRILPLDSPPADAEQTADAVLRYPAVKLFVERVAARGSNFVLTDSEAPFIADMCRRLDGLPLAIELAAGPMAALGVRSTVVRLVSQLELLKRGHRTAIPRHQTLKATLDWSYDLLSDVERIVFRRIGRFIGRFSLEGARYVAGERSFTDAEFFDAIAGLVEKSLVTSQLDQGEPQYRLLDTTRAYALEKLKEHAELDPVSSLYAEYVAAYLESKSEELSALSGAERVAAYSRQLSNVRSALDWSFGPNGNDEIAARLAAASTQLFMELSLLIERQGWTPGDRSGYRPQSVHRETGPGAPRFSLLEEYIGWAERAIAVSSRSADPDKRQQLELVAALAHAQMHSWGPGNPKAVQTFERMLALSGELDDTHHRARAYWGLCWRRLVSGEYSETLTLAEEFLNRYGDSGDGASVVAIKRMRGTALKLLGCLRMAAPLFEEVVAQPASAVRRGIDSVFSFDNRVSAMASLAGNLWLQGFAGRAIQMAQESLEAALSIDHVPSLCASLAISACPISLYADDIEAASKHVELLIERSREHHLSFWHLYGKSFGLALAHRRGAGVSLGDAPYLQMEMNRAGPLREQIGTHCPDICDPRLFSEAEQQSGWCRAELLRVKGELLLGSGDLAAQQAAESAFLLSLEWAREQGALFWEIKTALSLAESWKTNRRRDARDLIENVLGRYTDSYRTTDIRKAQRLYEYLR